MKKAFSALLALTMILSLVPAFAVSSHALQSGSWQYEVTGGKATITGIDSDAVSGTVIIPSKLGGYPVTAIGGSVFRGCSGLKNVSIPDSVKSIGDRAFYDCGFLNDVTIR